MSELKEKERYSGNWKGKEISFNREWGGHRFTDAECEALCAGEEIEVLGLISKKTGNTYGVKGHLAELDYNGNKYVGFESTGFVNDTKVPRSWAGHVFTDDEKVMLEAGKQVALDDCVSKKSGKKFKCTVTFEENDLGQMVIVPHF